MRWPGRAPQTDLHTLHYSKTRQPGSVVELGQGKSPLTFHDVSAQVSTIAQLTVLAPTEPSPRDGPLCVVNTHLFFHPRANHIRTIHAAAIAVEAGQLIQRIQGSVAISGLLRGRTPALVFCGDLNSGLTKGMPGAACQRCIYALMDAMSGRQGWRSRLQPQCLPHAYVDCRCFGAAGLRLAEPGLLGLGLW